MAQSASAVKARIPAAVKTDAQRKAEKEAYQRKRREKLAALKTADVNRWKLALNTREAKELGIAADWASFCRMKREAAINYWSAQEPRGPQVSEKARERKTNQFAKMKALYARLQEQLAALGVDPATVAAKQPEPKA